MKNKLLFTLFGLGIVATSTQIIFLREFLITFEGNELTIGIILANWLLSTALGSFIIGRLADRLQNKLRALGALQLCSIIYIACAVILIRLLKNILGLYIYQSLGPVPILLSSLVIQLPLCALLGGQFALCAALVKEQAREKSAITIGKSYIAEGAGAFLGSLCVTFLIITRFRTLPVAFGISIFYLLIFFYLHLRKKTTFFTWAAALAVISAIIFAGPVQNLDNYLINKQWQGYQVKEYENSKYANLVLAQRQNEYFMFENQVPFLTLPYPDLTGLEELAHIPMSLAKGPKNILVIGGGIGGLINELLKYDIAQVQYVELDPEVLRIYDAQIPREYKKELTDPRVKVIYTDARSFVSGTKDKYDAVFLNLPPPSTLSVNRFYTAQFYGQIKNILAEKGIFAFGMRAQEAYMSKESKYINACVYKTLASVFKDTKAVLGLQMLYMASESDIDLGLVEENFTKNNPEVKFLSAEYLKYRLSPENLSSINWLAQLENTRINTDLDPGLVFYNLAFWNYTFYPKSRFFLGLLGKIKPAYIFILAFAFFLCALAVKKISKKPQRINIAAVIFASGLCAIGFEIINIISLQIFHGYAYEAIGILIGAFMAGLPCGAFIANKLIAGSKASTKTLILSEFLIISYCAFVFFTLRGASAFLFPVSNFLIACLVGAQFPIASHLYLEDLPSVARTAGTIYAIDLFGSWLGSILIGAFLITILGIPMTISVLAFIKVLTLILLLL